jgi:DnaJ-class molecular chaperone
MAEKGLYAVLGIEEDVGLPTIKRAYRRLVFSVHPDVGATPDPQRFHEIHEAYEILADPERRRSGTRAEARPIYRRQMVVEPEPLSAKRRAVRVPDDFATTMPSIGEFLDHVAQNFFGFHRKSHGPYRRLGIEVLLSPEEARSGCRVPLEVPNFERCPRCRGFESGWGVRDVPRVWTRGRNRPRRARYSTRYPRRPALRGQSGERRNRESVARRNHPHRLNPYSPASLNILAELGL